MVEKVYKYINDNNMLDGCRHIAVGVSGGADSVCLIIVLHNIIKKYGLDIELTAVHVNHGIRGAEADRDEVFTRKLCESLGLPLVVRAVDVPKLASENGLSCEEAGRKVRYEILGGLAGSSGRIAVAHHMDDEAETVLLNIFRGCGLKGAGGIAPVRDNIIRPLLCVSRSEIEAYLKSIGQDYVTDSTNFSGDYTRNRLRNDIIPLIKSGFNPNVVERVCDMAEEMRGTEEYIKQQAEALGAVVCSYYGGAEEVMSDGRERSAVTEEVTVREESAAAEEVGSGGRERSAAIRRCKVDLEQFKAIPRVLQRRVIAGALAELSGSCKDIYRKHIDAVLELMDMQAGKEIHLPYGITAARSGEAVEMLKGYDNGSACDREIFCAELEPKRLLSEAAVIDIPGYVYYDGELRTGARIFFEVYENTGAKICESIEKNSNNDYTKYFDYDTIKDTICVRSRREGDYITISYKDSETCGYSVYGSKKLKKELTDKKIPGIFKDMVVLLAAGNDILWAAGVRQSMGYYVRNNTKRILKVSIDFKEDE